MLFGLVFWTNNIIVYLDLYVELLYKIVYFISNCLLRMKSGNYSIFRNIYEWWFITGPTVDSPTRNSDS
jgi:hypothetical protein